MSRMPVVSGSDCIRALRRVGYERTRQKGDHVRLACPGKPGVTVPLHAELKRGTLGKILDVVGLTVEEFRALL